MTKHRIVSGMRPTGPLHLGHHFGVLVNWLKLQEEFDCFYFVADWHAMTSEYADPRRIKQFVPELAKDWLAAGLDPAKCTIYQQSQIKEIAELHLILSMVTPLGWLERCPTFKDQKEQLAAKDLNTYGFLGYPVLMTTDIIMFRPDFVPVGEDQLPHLELKPRDRQTLQLPELSRGQALLSPRRRPSSPRSPSSRAWTGARCPRATATPSRSARTWTR